MLTDLTDLTWRTPVPGDLAALGALATRCLRTDGGQPDLATEPFLNSRFFATGGSARAAFDDTGSVVAAGAVRPQQAEQGRQAAYLGLVDPGWRGRGVGSELLDWGLATATTAGYPGGVVVESESLTEAATILFTRRGLRRTFAEEILRFDLAATRLPVVEFPAGVTVQSWRPELAGRFHAVYQAAFRERPGFPDWPAARWIDWTTDDDFRPEWSLLATEPVGADVAFVTAAEGWIIQVGVCPQRRGRGLAAALVTEVLRRARVAGEAEVLLDVNLDNQAGALYRRLGFTSAGCRARFAPAG